MTRAPRILAIASAGGHFVQLMRLMPVWKDCDTTVACSEPTLATEVSAQARAFGQTPPKFRTVTEANRWQRLRLARAALDVGWLVLSLRPSVVITTGAAPGYLALVFGRLIGARTIWIDSIANAEEMSLSGQKARRFADLCLTQWPELATPEGPEYKGSVL